MPSIHCIAPFFPEIFFILCFDSHKHLVMSSIPNLHNKEKLEYLWKLKRCQKRKTPPLFVIKGL